jgi:biuret amidohydrolase
MPFPDEAPAGVVPGELHVVGQPVLFIIDLQRGGAMGGEISGIDLMAGYESVIVHAERLVHAARLAGVPVVFFQETHRRSGLDIGRELDGAEGMHCIEGETATELWPTLVPGRDEHLIVKRRYSCFIGTDLEILLRGLRAETLLLAGVLTDVCVHYTFADAHQRDFHVRVATDAVAGSSVARHHAALDAMAYLQRDALVATAAVEEAFAAVPRG